MTKGRIIILVSATLSFSPFVAAEIYSCKDATGRVITSDRPIPECADRAVTVRKNVGQAAKEIPRPLTPEERRKAQAEEARQKELAIAEEERQKQERYLLTHYRNEDDIERDRKEKLNSVKEKIRIGNEQIQFVTKLLTDLEAEKLRRPQASPAESASFDNRANALRNSIKKTQDSNYAAETEQAKINAQFDAILKQYREIVLERKAKEK